MQQELILKLNSCKNHIFLLNKHVNDDEKIKIWFEQLCNLLANMLYSITNSVKGDKEKFDKAAKDNILLHLTQLTSSLSLLIQIFVRENALSIIITEARNCVKKQLVWCLDGLNEALKPNKTCIDSSGSFIKWMDASLDQLSEIDLSSKSLSDNVRICHKARQITEEVLCHAMSIAQVALTEDCKIIKGSSQAVLEAFDHLHQELLKPVTNASMVNLFVDCCNDKLCALERKVNEAVLKLCLKLFANYVGPLNKLHEFCLNNYDEDKLDMLIADFDTHVDQIMQVGLFAVACTVDKYTVKMRSCLASLEALEVEMVPAFNSLLKEKSLHNVNLSLILKNYWLHQANCLRNLVFLIIDPYAFARLTYEEIDACLSNVVDEMKKNNYVINFADFENIVDKGAVLRDMLQASIEDAGLVDVKKHFKDFKDILYEVKAASRVFLKTKSNLRENSLRIIKRCKILLTVHKRLLVALAECDYEKSPNKSNNVDENEAQGKVQNDDLCGEDNPALEQLIERGKQLIKDRSVLYKTPVGKKSNALALQNCGLNFLKAKSRSIMPLSKLVHLRNASCFINSSSLSCRKPPSESTIDLQITDILEELTALGNSFRS